MYFRNVLLTLKFCHLQQQKQSEFLHSDPNRDDAEYYANEHEQPQWGWNWLEHWMASQPYHNRNLGPHDSSYMALIDNLSEKTVEMDLVRPVGSENVTHNRLSMEDTVESVQYPTRSHRQSGSDGLPSYMAPTKSAKAKVRTQGSAMTAKPRGPPVNQWNPSTKRGPVVGLGYGDSSSSGGGTTAYQGLKSPSPKGNGFHGQAKWMGGYSPDSSGGDDRAMGGHGWRHQFG